MHNITLLSHDNLYQWPCTAKMAKRLLDKGKARIVKLYPYTLKLKGALPWDDYEAEPVRVSPTPKAPLASAKRNLPQKQHLLEGVL